MQIVSNGHNLHEMSDPVFWEIKKKYIYILAAAFAHRVAKVDLNNILFL